MSSFAVNALAVALCACGSSTGTNESGSSTDATSEPTDSQTSSGTVSSSATTTEGESSSSGADTGTSEETGETGRCGDGMIDGGEECDDGNTENLDGCSQWCLEEGPIRQICPGTFKTCALAAGGLVKCWGANEHGDLGLGDTVDRGDEPGEMGDALPLVALGMPVEQIGCGSFGCARSGAGTIKCWGWNFYGSLGRGDTEDRGDEPGEMGDALPPVDLAEPALAMAVGQFHACAILASGAVRCWGLNYNGQLGLGDQEIRGDEPGEMGDALPPVDLGGMELANLAAGSTVSCARDVLDRIRCWGGNSWGQLGYGDTESRGDEPGEMGDALLFVDLGTGAEVAQAAPKGNNCAVLVDGRLKCWGKNEANLLWPWVPAGMYALGDEPGEMGDNLPAYDLGERSAVKVALGAHFACVMLDDGSLKCWGANAFGVMGQGTDTFWDGEPLADLAPVDVGTSETVMDVAISWSHVCVLLQSGHVKCWGDNRFGQLGYGDTEARGDDPGEMGDALPYVEIF